MVSRKKCVWRKEYFILLILHCSLFTFVRTSIYPTSYCKVSTIERVVSWLAWYISTALRLPSFGVKSNEHLFLVYKSFFRAEEPLPTQACIPNITNVRWLPLVCCARALKIEPWRGLPLSGSYEEAITAVVTYLDAFTNIVANIGWLNPVLIIRGCASTREVYIFFCSTTLRHCKLSDLPTKNSPPLLASSLQASAHLTKKL